MTILTHSRMISTVPTSFQDMLPKLTVKGLRDIQWAALYRLDDDDPAVRANARGKLEMLATHITSRGHRAYRKDMQLWLNNQRRKFPTGK